MKELKSRNEIIHGFEMRIFRYTLGVAFIYRFIRLVHEYIADSPLPVLLLGTLNLFLFVFLFPLSRKHLRAASIIFYFQILLTSILTWNNTGGWNGSIPYLLLVLIVVVVITSHGALQIITLVA